MLGLGQERIKSFPFLQILAKCPFSKRTNRSLPHMKIVFSLLNHSSWLSMCCKGFLNLKLSPVIKSRCLFGKSKSCEECNVMVLNSSKSNSHSSLVFI